MANNGLLSKLKRKTIPFFTAAALSLGSVYGCKTETIEPNQKPFASFIATPKEGYAPLTSCFDGSSSKAFGGFISKFIWQFENGVVDSISGARVCHTYQAPENYMAGLTVEDNKGERSPQVLEQIIARDGSPVIDIQNLNGNEDEVSSLDLTGKIKSPIYNIASLTITTTSPDLNVTRNGSTINYTNKIKDTLPQNPYIDFRVEDPEGRQVNKRVPIVINPQTDIKGYLEHVLTGARIPNIPIIYGGIVRDTSDANGEFDFQVAISNDTLKIITPIDSTKFEDILGVRFFKDQYYKFSFPISASGQDTTLNNQQLIQRAYETQIVQNQAIKVDLLDFMKKYMLEGRWDDADMPIKVFIDNNPPSPEYREAVRKGIMELWQPAVNQWLPQGRQINLAEIANSDPVVGNRVDYTSNDFPQFAWVSLTETFKKGIIFMNPIQLGDARARAAAHEFGHSFGFFHSPHLNHNMHGTYSVTPSPFEGLIVATKYKLKKGFIGFYEN